MKHGLFALLLAVTTLAGQRASAQDTSRGDEMIAEYFRIKTAELTHAPLPGIQSLDDWKQTRDTHRQQLFEMLGLSPLPERTGLKPVVTRKLDHEEFTVEMLHFQSMPGLYVTANLYIPKGLEEPAPAVLYLCGHASVIQDGVSYGNKTAYHHHAVWFARNGYVCLVIDTIQLGEIRGLHHGTHREGMWWWNARGYTPAGVEAWNGIRALDYLQSRPEVDPERLGATGRSGGGVYSWWVAALDERIKAVAPVAGITDLRNHVVDGVVSGHCDCMFKVNTYRWDYAMVAALVAPRPLLIANTDKDRIFPLEGIVRLHAQVERIYQLHNAADSLGLLITEGPHRDSQELQLPVFRWFNRFLKQDDSLIEMAAVRWFEPKDLKVFDHLPEDEIVTRVHETFVPAAGTPEPPQSQSQWTAQRDAWMAGLRETVFRSWPEAPADSELEQVFSTRRHGLQLQAYEFTSQDNIRLRFYLLQDTRVRRPSRVSINALDHEDWGEWLRAMHFGFADSLDHELRSVALTDFPDANSAQEIFDEFRRSFQERQSATIYFAPRGVGLTFLDQDKRRNTHVRRRFMLLGETLDSGRVWDIRRMIQVVRALPAFRQAQVDLHGRRGMGVNVLYASLFEPAGRLDLWRLPKSHQDGPDYLNILRILDVPQAVALAGERSQVSLHRASKQDWHYPLAVARNLGWRQTQVQLPASSEPPRR